MTQEQSNNDIFQQSMIHLDQFKVDCLDLLSHLESRLENMSDDEDNMETNGKDEISLGEDEIISDLQKKIYVETVQLRQLNWEVQEITNQIKESTTHEKNEVDLKQLDIQNIYYQHKHLKSEIERCNDFHSKHESLDLVPLSEFYESHPEAIGIEDPHNLMLQRLKDEEDRRLELFIAKTRLNNKKKKLSEDNKRRKEDLDKLDSMLRDFVESTEPIQKALQKY